MGSDCQRDWICNCSRDSISKLPDEILHHLLSFLPTKIAVGTSILSTRWRHLWTSLLVLDFNDGLPSHIRELDENIVRKMSFVHFVNRVLVHNVLSIQIFRLSCGTYCKPFLYTWICTAVERNVEELELDLYVEEMPLRLFTCKTLVVLKLASGINLDIHLSVWLPSLKVLHITLGKCKDGTTCQKLLSGCPVLEEMVINRYELDKQWDFDISSVTLKSLSILFSVDEDILSNSDDPMYELVFNTPKLEYLNLIDGVSENFVVENLSSLVKAYVDVEQTRQKFFEFDGYEGCIFEFFKDIAHVKFLSLSEETLQCIGFASSFTLPTFHNLTHLECRSVNSDCCWKLLIDFLNNAPHLEVLIMKEGCSSTGDYVRWSPPQCVPICLLSHLKEIEIETFYNVGKEVFTLDVLLPEYIQEILMTNAVDFMLYLLQNSEVLKKMTIGGKAINLEERSCACKKLLKVIANRKVSKLMTQRCHAKL